MIKLAYLHFKHFSLIMFFSSCASRLKLPTQMWFYEVYSQRTVCQVHFIPKESLSLHCLLRLSHLFVLLLPPVKCGTQSIKQMGQIKFKVKKISDCKSTASSVATKTRQVNKENNDAINLNEGEPYSHILIRTEDETHNKRYFVCS